MKETQKSAFMIGDLSVEPSQNRLRTVDQTASIEPRMMDLLCVLASEPGRTFSREELIDRVWQVEYGADESLSRAISVIRKAIRDAGASAPYIETIPRRGYRLVQPVKALSQSEARSKPTGPSSHQTSRSGGQRYSLFGVIVVGIVLLGMWILQSPGSKPVMQASNKGAAKADQSGLSVAVLPFSDLSEDQDQAYLSDGIAEEVLNALARIDDLKVIGRRSSFVYREQNTPLSDVGEALGVSHIVTGSVRLHNDRLRISAQLNDTRDSLQIWSDTFMGSPDQIFDLQEQIAKAVARSLEIQLTGELAETLTKAGTTSPEAYDLYLQSQIPGQAYDIDVSLLTRAIELDPQFARAYAARADAHVMRTQAVDADPAPYWEKVEDDAFRAIELDPTIGQSYGALGYMHYLQRDFLGMEPYFRAGMEADPNDARLIYSYMVATFSTGRLVETNSLVDRLLEIEPTYHWYVLYKAFLLYSFGDVDTANKLAVPVSDAGSTTWEQIPGWTAGARGNAEEAGRLLTESWEYFDTGLSDQEMRAVFTAMYGSDVEKTRAIEIIDNARARRAIDAPNRLLPAFYMYVGEREKALEMFYAKTDPTDEVFFGRIWQEIGGFADFKRSPEMREFAERTGLLAYWKTYGWPDACRPVPGTEADAFVCE